MSSREIGRYETIPTHYGVERKRDPDHGRSYYPQGHTARAGVAGFGLADGLGSGLVKAQAVLGHIAEFRGEALGAVGEIGQAFGQPHRRDGAGLEVAGDALGAEIVADPAADHRFRPPSTC